MSQAHLYLCVESVVMSTPKALQSESPSSLQGYLYAFSLKGYKQMQQCLAHCL